MLHRRLKGLGLLAAVVAILVIPTTVVAQEGEMAQGPNMGNLSIELNATVTSEYIWRGLIFENQGFIAQTDLQLTWSDVLGNVIPADWPVGPVDVFVGQFNSFHEQKTGGTGSWFEADFWAGTSIRIADLVDFSFTYRWFAFPLGPVLGPGAVTLRTAEEAQFMLSYDDSDNPLLGDVALRPYALFVVQTKSLAVGTPEGGYFEMGIEPSFVILDSADYPVTLAIPVVLGLNLSDFYFDVNGNEETFGYVKVGFHASVPLTALIDPKFGTWTFTAGVDLWFLGDGTDQANAAMNGKTDDFEAVFFGTLGMTY